MCVCVCVCVCVNVCVSGVRCKYFTYTLPAYIGDVQTQCGRAEIGDYENSVVEWSPPPAE